MACATATRAARGQGTGCVTSRKPRMPRSMSVDVASQQRLVGVGLGALEEGACEGDPPMRGRGGDGGLQRLLTHPILAR
jgi:hypothetical protein